MPLEKIYSLFYFQVFEYLCLHDLPWGCRKTFSAFARSVVFPLQSNLRRNANHRVVLTTRQSQFKNLYTLWKQVVLPESLSIRFKILCFFLWQGLTNLGVKLFRLKQGGLFKNEKYSSVDPAKHLFDSCLSLIHKTAIFLNLSMCYKSLVINTTKVPLSCYKVKVFVAKTMVV